VTSSWFFLSTLNYDARSTTHQIDKNIFGWFSHSYSASWYYQKLKWSRKRPGVAQRVGRSTALLFHDRGTIRGWVVSSTLRPHFTPGKDPVPIVQEAGWAPGSVCTGGKSRLHRDSIPDRPARSQSLCRLSYRVHLILWTFYLFTNWCTGELA